MGATAAVLVLAAGAAIGVGGAPDVAPATALTPPVAMTADELPTWQTNGIVHALAEADGVVYAGGTFSTVRPPGAAPGTQEQPAVNFVALDAATGEPTGCEISFTVGSGTATVRALEVSPDGSTLYAGGFFGSVNGTGASSVAAFDTATCERLPFPVAASGTVRALAASDDRLYLAGDFGQVNGQSRQRFAAVDTAGALTGWVANADEVGRAVVVTPDGQNVILGGDFFRINGANTHALAVVDAQTGANTRNYPLGFIETRSVVMDLTTDETGFYTGNEGTGGGVFDGRIALDLDTFDQRWRDTCLGATQAVVVYKKVLYSGHHAHDCSSMGAFPNQERYHLFAQSVDDPQLLGWFPDTNDGLGEALGPRVMAVSEDHPTDGRDFLWVGGGFTTVNGSPQWGLTRFADSPDTGNPVTPEAHAFSTTPGEIEVTWRSSLDLDDSLLTYHVYRNGGGTPVHTVQGHSLPWERPQLSFTDTDVTEGQSYSYRVRATDGAGNASALSPPVSATVTSSGHPYADAVLADNPQFYWRLDETAGNFASDASGNNHSGVHRGGPQRGVTPAAVPGPDAAALRHNGSTTYTYSDHGYTAPNQFTLETWFRTDTNSGGRLIGFGNRILQNSSSRDRHIYMTDSGQLVFGVYPGAYRTITTPASYNDGQWHHVVATLGSNGMRLYVDGQLRASNIVWTSGQNYNVKGYWRIGGDGMGNWPSRPSSHYFAGDLDETAVYHHTLSAARVAAHYQAASAPMDTVTQVAPVADTYVNQAAAGTVHGTHQQLAVRGTSRYESYLRFEVPQAPPGTVLKSAALRVRLTSDSYAGSTDDHHVVPVTGSWSEATTSWNNRPAVDAGQVLGTLSGADTPGSMHTVPLDTAAVASAPNGEIDLALISEGTTSLWLWSREASQSSYAPQLVLTFGAP
ncbi:LamG-like jellyroll fold domain-containing protein [Streptomyces sodiiphilus]